MKDHIIVDVADDVARLTLNDPETLNALTMKMVEQLMEGLAFAQANARVIVLSGNGRAFCSGANLSGGAGTGASGSDAAKPLRTHFDPLIAAIRDLTIPIVTKVQGAAAGYGASLALAGDVIVASETAFFQQAFAQIGLVPDGGSAFTLVKAIGRVRATRMMLLGERICAAQALDWGLITQVSSEETLNESADALVRQLRSGPTRAYHGIRQMAWAACDGTLEDAFDLEVRKQTEMLATEDHRNALAAFVAKRKPVFTGR